MSQKVELPSYLLEPKVFDHSYGTLRYDPQHNHWVIIGDPIVVQMAKRLFPGSEGRGHGVAKFPANKRSTADLNWLMQRFPLTIEDEDFWRRLREEAIQHVLKRKEINERSQRFQPPPTFKGKLEPFQEEGLAFLLHNERALLADETGLGKTPTSLAWLATLNQWPALIVVQPHMVLQWEHEVRRFLDFRRVDQNGATLLDLAEDARLVHVIKGLTPYELPESSLYIVHYLLLRGWKSYLPYFGFKAVIFDEIQELRRRQSEKYSAASLIADAADYVIGLSGTPIHNNGGEIWNVLNIIERHCLGDWDSFTREWCYGYGDDRVKNAKLLGEYLRREGLMLRRRKNKEIQLPPKRRYVQLIDFDKNIYDSLIGRVIKLAIKSQQTTDYYERGRLLNEAINETRRITGLAKAKYVCAFVKSLLDSGERVILYAHHHDVWDVYKRILKDYHPVSITGRETLKQKEESKQAFIQGKTNLIMIGLRSASGIDGLQERANVVVFGELDWSPAVHTQAEDRVHRMNQKYTLLCYYLVCNEGTDQEMLDALGFKVEQFTGIMGDPHETNEDRVLAEHEVKKHMARVIEKLSQNRKKNTIADRRSAS